MHQNLGRAKCSVLLPVRNGEMFVRESLQNLIQLTTPDDEILIINDGSTDSTSAILAEYQELHERVKVIDTPPLGLVAALNKGLASAKNEFIVRADIDSVNARTAGAASFCALSAPSSAEPYHRATPVSDTAAMPRGLVRAVVN